MDGRADELMEKVIFRGCFAPTKSDLVTEKKEGEPANDKQTTHVIFLQLHYLRNTPVSSSTLQFKGTVWLKGLYVILIYGRSDGCQLQLVTGLFNLVTTFLNFVTAFLYPVTKFLKLVTGLLLNIFITFLHSCIKQRVHIIY